MASKYKIGDYVVKATSINDDTLYTISEVFSTTVVLNGYRYETGTQFIRPATIEERQLDRRICH